MSNDWDRTSSHTSLACTTTTLLYVILMLGEVYDGFLKPCVL